MREFSCLLYTNPILSTSYLSSHCLCCLNKIDKALFCLGDSPCLKSAVRINPELAVIDPAAHLSECINYFLNRRNTGAVDIIYSGSYFRLEVIFF